MRNEPREAGGPHVIEACTEQEHTHAMSAALRAASKAHVARVAEEIRLREEEEVS